MPHTISCRTSTFGDPLTAFPILAAAGLRHAEAQVSPDTDYTALARAAAAAGIAVATLSTGVDLDDDASRAHFRRAIDGAADIGTARIFCSLKSAQPMAETTIQRLRELVAHAAARQVTLAMETHPPFGANAGTALRTLDIIGSPALRYNFDTANLYYYNHGLNAVDQLKYCRHKVASLHLKDTNGGFEDATFPIVGQGIVDFPTIFQLLDEIHFDGPCTLELEGHALNNHAAGRADFLKHCLAYLADIGAFAP